MTNEKTSDIAESVKSDTVSTAQGDATAAVASDDGMNANNSEATVSGSGAKGFFSKPSFIIARRELGSYFSSPLAYIIIAVNAILLGLTFFKGLFLGYMFFAYKSSDLRLLFLFQSVLLTLFIPLLASKLYVEEKRTLTIETLMALPVTALDVFIGKFLAAFITSLAVIAPCAINVILISLCGALDVATVVVSFIGLILIASLFIAISLFCSVVARNQNIALFTSLPVCAFLMAVYIPFSAFPQSVPPVLDSFVRFLSVYEHFKNTTHGMLDIRDIIYFLSLATIFMLGCAKYQDNNSMV